jgi:penicillin amidase
MKTFLRFLGFLSILIVFLLGLAFYWTFWKPLPQYETVIESPELSSPVDIYWDDFGIPHIYAQTQQDLYYALGYVHAQDRRWQLTLAQLAMEGRFAEFLGPDLIPLDRYQRTLGFWSTANKIINTVDSETISILEAYSKGINDFTLQNENALPIEFALSGIPPITWTPTHSIGLTRLMAWDLNLSWWSELMYQSLSEKLSSDAFRDIMVQWADSLPTSLSTSEAARLSAFHHQNSINQESLTAIGSTKALLDFFDQEWNRRLLFETTGSHVGSNAWAIDGTKTESGYPILAGDPHLGLDMPGKWYEVHLNYNGKNASGASLPGLPGIVLGQNDYLAWSFTNIMADDTDFYLEIINENDRGQYRRDRNGEIAYEDLTIEREIIKVKNDPDVIFDRRITTHGPIISDIYPSASIVDSQVISMQWTGHEISHEISSMLGINWADDIRSFQEALKSYGVPGQNIMYADKVGNIGMFSTAKLPIRNENPVALRPGWNPDYDWKSWIPFESMPKVINPRKSWIANANNKITPGNYPYYIASFWEPASRIQRIEEVLNSSNTIGLNDVEKLQTDVYSKFAEQLTPIILEYINSQNEYDFSIALSYLENWDYKYTASSTAASIFDVFFLRFTENTLKDEFGEDLYKHFIRHELIPVRVIPHLISSNSTLFDDLSTENIENVQDIVLKSMQETILYLSDTFGSEPYEWRWGQLHTLTFSPPLFKEAAEDSSAPTALKLIVNNLLSHGPFTAEGHGMSVNNGQYNWEHPFEMVLGASIRRIVDFSNLSSTKSVLPTGQSGNPFSQHFGDQTNLWLNGQYKTFVQDSSIVKLSNWRHMQLTPAP